MRDAQMSISRRRHPPTRSRPPARLPRASKAHKVISCCGQHPRETWMPTGHTSTLSPPAIPGFRRACEQDHVSWVCKRRRGCEGHWNRADIRCPTGFNCRIPGMLFTPRAVHDGAGSVRNPTTKTAIGGIFSHETQAAVCAK